MGFQTIGYVPNGLSSRAAFKGSYTTPTSDVTQKTALSVTGTGVLRRLGGTATASFGTGTLEVWIDGVLYVSTTVSSSGTTYLGWDSTMSGTSSADQQINFNKSLVVYLTNTSATPASYAPTVSWVYDLMV